jgi:hypothetical protein
MTYFSERRMHERYRLDLPCLLSLEEDRVSTKVVELRTRDLSGGGVFLDLTTEIDIGASARLDIIIPSSLIRCDDGSATHISANGSIVRMEPGGVAVSFHEDYRIAPLDEVLRNVKAKMNWMARMINNPNLYDLKNILRIAERKVAGECK